MKKFESDEETLEFLAKHEAKELLRFVTIGSVDDGKSTLIGRLLYESGGIFDDQLDAVTSTSAEGETEINFANLTDGLVAEREQGITIDVAYRYSATPRRKFIIADTPGHVQYTRNMATGASTADAAIILIDARLGVLQQSRRHATIADLLGIDHLLVAVNKMDLVDYDQATFEKIQSDFLKFADSCRFKAIQVFPVSALKGDNIVSKSERTSWWNGLPLLEHLEALPLTTHADDQELVLPVQLVLRPDLDFRGYAGTLASGRVRPGQTVKILPSGKTTKVERIVDWNGDLPEAASPRAVTITLQDEIDISRGDVITTPKNELHISRRLEATLVWMDETKLELNRPYFFKHMTSLVSGSVAEIQFHVNMDTLEEEPADTLALNDVGRAIINLNRPLIVDKYVRNKTAGSFIMIDRVTNATVAAGMIRDHGADYQDDSRSVASALTPEERAARFHQKPTVIWFTGRAGVGKIVVARELERRLFDSGHMPFVLDPVQIEDASRNASGEELRPVVEHARLCAEAGLIAVTCFTSPLASDRAQAKERIEGSGEFLEVFFDASPASCRARLLSLGRDPEEAVIGYQSPEDPDLTVRGDELDIEHEVDRIVAMLERRGLLTH